MKARFIPQMIVVSLLLGALYASPLKAGTSQAEYTGTVEYVSWTEPVPPVVTPGGVIHQQFISKWSFHTTDVRLSGVYVITGVCTWPQEKSLGWGPCQATWTADVNGDKLADWEGAMSLVAHTKHDQWNGTGHGLGEYAGLNVSFKVYDVATVVSIDRQAKWALTPPGRNMKTYVLGRL
jgi:hypothetical protein